MAIAAPVLQSYVSGKFNVKGGLVGSAIAAGIGIATYVYQNYDLTSPFSDVLQPGQSRRPGSAFIDASQTDASTNKFRKALRTSNKYKRRFGFEQARRYRQCCCCTCNRK